jgi:hypothetical protein
MKMIWTVALVALALLSIAAPVNAFDTKAFWEHVERLCSGDGSPARLAPSVF